MQTFDGIAIPTMVTPGKAAELTGLAADHIRGLCKMGKIVHVKAGSKFLINLELFVEYLNKGEQVSLNDGKS